MRYLLFVRHILYPNLIVAYGYDASSILHVVDRSLPTKPCKTCKNRFHSGCLYKVSKLSHSFLR